MIWSVVRYLLQFVVFAIVHDGKVFHVVVKIIQGELPKRRGEIDLCP